MCWERVWGDGWWATCCSAAPTWWASMLVFTNVCHVDKIAWSVKQTIHVSSLRCFCVSFAARAHLWAGLGDIERRFASRGRVVSYSSYSPSSTRIIYHSFTILVSALYSGKEDLLFGLVHRS
ncbi:hypothetical protein F5X96DRAFT_261829 [Biscogniauxia mediterranea]|nr:hypothetical protein F5X96DRAFT_261829 [Biscogniauxia mediterranea]